MDSLFDGFDPTEGKGKGRETPSSSRRRRDAPMGKLLSLLPHILLFDLRKILMRPGTTGSLAIKDRREELEVWLLWWPLLLLLVLVENPRTEAATKEH